jgi:hypothetical protein
MNTLQRTQKTVHIAPRSGRAAAALALLATLAACDTKDAPGPLEPSGPVARVRFVNLITDTTRGRVNAILEGLPFGVNLTYSLSTPATLPAPSTAFYAAILAGDRTLVLKRTADTSVTVATIDFSIQEGHDRTIYAMGGAVGTAVTSFITTDTNPAPPAIESRLRLVHLSPPAGPLDVFVTAPGADLATATPTVADLRIQGLSPYVVLAPGTVQVRAVPAGTPAGSRAANVVINSGNVAAAGGTGRTVVLADNNVGGAPLRAVVLSDR